MVILSISVTVPTPLGPSGHNFNFSSHPSKQAWIFLDTVGTSMQSWFNLSINLLAIGMIYSQLIRFHHPTSPTTTSLDKFRLDFKKGKKPEKQSSILT